MPGDVKKVLRKFEYGVYVVTMGQGNSGNAFTASWVSQVSSEPPMVAVAVKSEHQSTPKMKEHGAFVVNLIPEGREEVAKTYYGPAESGYEKLRKAILKDSPATKTPILSGALGWLDCEIVETVKAGNHTLFIGEVKDGGIERDDHILTKTNTGLSYGG